MQFAMQAAERVRRLASREGMESVTMVGPAKCPVERIKNRWRWHLMLKSSQPAALTRVGRHLAERLEVPSRGQLRIVVDRDPVSLL